MLLHDRSYLDALHALLKDAQQASVAVAFWGEGSDSAFKHWRGKSLRIVCNLALGGTNPEIIPNLQALPGAEVRQLDNLHAKLVLTDRTMVLGSANMSANGLGLEANEAAGFRELGVQTSDPDLLKQARRWFRQLWAATKPIGAQDLERARKAWAKRRTRRPVSLTSKSPSLLELSPEALKDREIYFAVFRTGLSPMARKRLDKENQKLASQSHPEHAKLDLYEGWEEDDLPKDPSAIIIPIYWGQRGKIEVRSPQRPVPELEGRYREQGETYRLDFTAIVKDLDRIELPFRLGGMDRRGLIEPIREWLVSLIDHFDIEDDVALCVPVYDFLQWRSDKRGN